MKGVITVQERRLHSHLLEVASSHVRVPHLSEVHKAIVVSRVRLQRQMINHSGVSPLQPAAIAHYPCQQPAAILHNQGVSSSTVDSYTSITRSVPCSYSSLPRTCSYSSIPRSVPAAIVHCLGVSPSIRSYDSTSLPRSVPRSYMYSTLLPLTMRTRGAPWWSMVWCIPLPPAPGPEHLTRKWN